MITSITPYLSFSDSCEDALKFYTNALGAEVKNMMRVSDGPKEYQGDPAHLNKIMHAEVRVGNASFMASDSIGQPTQTGSNTSLNLNFERREEIESAWKKMIEGGTVMMELQDTFWGSRFGMLRDKFGINWMLNCSIKAN
jgi:PhnB protein